MAEKDHSGSLFKKAPPFEAIEAAHQVLDATKFPKMTASQQPDGQQKAFSQFYPNGLPVTYNMVNGYDSSGVPQQYIENHLPPQFYINAPAHAAAKFSSFYGQKSPRRLEKVLAERRIHLWNRDEVQSVCNSLRQTFWSDMKRLQRPCRWDDLWEFFDAYDLYHYGALNLWNVINHLYDENQAIAMTVKMDMAVEIGHYADEWLKLAANTDKLKQWNGDQGPIMSVLSTEDWRAVGNLEDEEISLLRSALVYRRDMLISHVAQSQKLCCDLETACQSGNLVNWLGEFAGRHDESLLAFGDHGGGKDKVANHQAAETRVLGSHGLPSPPLSEAQPVSAQSTGARVPCFVRNGCHYYHWLGPDAAYPESPKTSVVQALRKSSDAAMPKGPLVVSSHTLSSESQSDNKGAIQTGSDEEAEIEKDITRPGQEGATPVPNAKSNMEPKETEARAEAESVVGNDGPAVIEDEKESEQQDVDEPHPVHHGQAEGNNIVPRGRTPRHMSSSPNLRRWGQWESPQQQETRSSQICEGDGKQGDEKLSRDIYKSCGAAIQALPATGLGPQLA
ncbi:hypothetical protein CDD82_6613 [Ophiocordyceps australis]|uniref:Uncharacterized protein n=1 Tax=Ophiocordyceps australis TaxID=1399860 RepID=A0A2C5ZNI1_9HYPO|nr:hypothetical protein CDD82_6613 [Ophiocordyceps australis]